MINVVSQFNPPWKVVNDRWETRFELEDRVCARLEAARRDWSGGDGGMVAF